MALRPGSEFAGYVIERVLGAGGMGEVYVARHPRLPRSDAIKVLNEQYAADPQFRARFEREADLAAALSHPAIVKVYDRGETNGHLWIAMELVTGEDLSKRLRQSGPLAANQAAFVIATVADALDRANASGLVHRDVKPANILLSTDGDVLLTDFGIARMGSESSELTGTGVTVGTLNYASPEQLSGLPLDGRSDQYSLACTAFQLLTGVAPFANSNAAIVISGHMSRPLPSVRDKRPDLANEVDGVLARATAKDRDLRFASAAEMAAALRAALTLPAPPVAGPTAPQPALAPRDPGPRNDPADPDRTQLRSADPNRTLLRSENVATPSTDATPRASRRPVLVGLATAVVVILAVAVGAYIVASRGPDLVSPTDEARTLPQVRVTALSGNLSSKPSGDVWRNTDLTGYPQIVAATADRLVGAASAGTQIFDTANGRPIATAPRGASPSAPCIITAAADAVMCLSGKRVSIINLLTGAEPGASSVPASSSITVSGETFVAVATGSSSPQNIGEGTAFAYDSSGRPKWKADGYVATVVTGASIIPLVKRTAPSTPFEKQTGELVFRDIQSGNDVYRKQLEETSKGSGIDIPAWQVYAGGFVVDSQQGAEIYANDGRKIATAQGWRTAKTPEGKPQNAPYSDSRTEDTKVDGKIVARTVPGNAPPVPFLQADSDANIWGAFSPQSGKLMWSTQIEGNEFGSKQSGNTYFHVAGMGSSILLNTFDPVDKLKYRAYHAYTGDGGALPDGQVPLVTDGTLFVTATGKTVNAVRPGDATPLWSLDLGTGPAGIEGKIYYGNARLI